MQEIKKIEIQTEPDTIKVFTVKELTVKQLIELSQTNSLLGGESKKKDPGNAPGSSFVHQLLSFRPDLEKVMKMSCSFTFDDLIELPPSDIKIIFEGFQEVNQSFLEGLEKLGLLETLKKLLGHFIKIFSM